MESQVSQEKMARMVVQESGEKKDFKESGDRQALPILNPSCTNLPLQWSMKQEHKVTLELQSP